MIQPTGGITTGSSAEAEVGLALEKLGRLAGPIQRETSGRAEFIDVRGTLWDVKAFRSFTPKGERIDIMPALKKIDDELASGENLILDTRGLSPDDVIFLRQHIETQGMNARVLWF